MRRSSMRSSGSGRGHGRGQTERNRLISRGETRTPLAPWGRRLVNGRRNEFPIGQTPRDLVGRRIRVGCAAPRQRRAPRPMVDIPPAPGLLVLAAPCGGPAPKTPPRRPTGPPRSCGRPRPGRAPGSGWWRVDSTLGCRPHRLVQVVARRPRPGSGHACGCWAATVSGL